MSELLGLQPTSVIEKGSRSRSGDLGSANIWSIDVETLDAVDDDESGTRALGALLDRCAPAVGRVRDLPSDCSPRIIWSALSDSEQGGFVLTVGLLSALAGLGVDVYATTYLDDEG
jgi:hypothetical protein